MQDHPQLTEATPVRGDVGILVLPESQLFNFAAEFGVDSYAGDVFGVHRALWEANIAADFVKTDRIGEYPLVFVPFPLMIEAKNAEILKNYVAGGGTLISHACPAHFADHGYCCLRVPGLGLDELFGAVEEEVEYVPNQRPDSAKTTVISHRAGTVACALYQEKLRPTTGREVGWFADGAVGIVESDFGRGRARLIGTFPGLSYLRGGDPSAADLIRDALSYAGVRPAVAVSEPEVMARLHSGPTGTFLWIVNTQWAEKDVEVRLDESVGALSGTEELTEGWLLRRAGNSLILSLPPRDGAIIRLEFR